MNERRPARGFDVVETWVFDLDNTLYPHHLNLWQQVDARIRDYIVGFLNVTHDEALRVQKDYYRRYGTTMRGLMEEHGLDPDKFLAVVHEIDHDVFDIAAADLEPKPRPQVYDRFLKRHGVDPAKAAIFEDLARNLEVPHALGMTTVLVVPSGTREVFREEWELAGRDAPHVDHVTHDLAGFLRGIAARRGGGS